MTPNREPMLETLKCEFDDAWYLNAYPDVREQQIDAWQHFLAHGHREGRLPRQLQAQRYERILWSLYADLAVAQLEAIANDPDGLRFERSYACWALGSWHASQGSWRSAYDMLALHFHLGALLPGHAGPVSLFGLCAAMVGNTSDVLAARRHLKSRRHETDADMLEWHDRRRKSASATSSTMRRALEEASIEGLNRRYEAHGLLPVHTLGSAAGFGSLRDASVTVSAHPDPKSVPMVSVLMAVRNSIDTLEVALASVLRQTWPHIELIVVDDGSQDGSMQTLQRILHQDSLRPGIAVQIWRHETALGAYRARNTALAAATGEFITVHDADDWSHPEKIEQQVGKLLGAPDAAASMSHWVRVNQNLELVPWFPEPTCVHRNLSSLMIRAEVIRKLGFWDNVKFAADSEYFERIQRAYGPHCIVDVCPGIPLSFGLQHSNSLTQGAQSHIAGSVSGARYRYANLYRRWHGRATSIDDLYLPSASGSRPFPAPVGMTDGAPCLGVGTPEDLIESSDLWDESWYVVRYPDVAAYPDGPLLHYVRHGAQEGRDPGPSFSSSGYRALHGDNAGRAIALLDFITRCDQEPRDALPAFKGRLPCQDSAKTLLLAGHQAIEQAFGAERCLVDAAIALSEAGYNVVVTLPAAGNLTYLGELLAHSIAVAVIPDIWRRLDLATHPATLAHQIELMTRYRVDAVHVNTVVQQSIMDSARLAGVSVVVHAHELPAGDPELCASLGMTPETVRDVTLSGADVVVANSSAVQRFFDDGTTPVRLVPNSVRDMEALSAIDPRNRRSPLVVGMLSSNTAKKGVGDFAAVAKAFRMRRRMGDTPEVEFVLYGPLTPLVDAVLEEARESDTRQNLFHAGYVEDPADALRALDVLVNLSHVDESFGQSVAEALVAGKPCVVYARGALCDLVQDGVNGYHVAPGQIDDVVERISHLASHPEQYQLMSAAARLAAENLSFAAFRLRLAAVYHDLLPP